MFDSSTPDGLAPIGSTALIAFIASIGGLSMVWGIANLVLLIRVHPDSDGSQKLDRVLEVYRKLLRGAIDIIKLNAAVGFAATVVFFLLIMGAVEHFESFYFCLAYLIGSVNSILIAAVSAIVSCIVKPKIVNFARFSIFDAFDAARKAANFQTYFFIGQVLTIMGLFLVNYEISNQEQIKKKQQIIKVAKCLIYFSFGASTVSIGSRIVNSIYAKGADLAVQTLDIYQDRLRKDYKHPALISKALGQIMNREVSSVLDYVVYLSAGMAAAVYAASYNIVGTDQEGEIIFSNALSNCYLPILSVAFSLFYNLFFNMILHLVFRDTNGDGIRTVLNIHRYASTILLIGFQSLAAYLCLPAEFYMDELGADIIKHPWHAYLCILFGLLVCAIISLVAEIYTTHPFFINSISTSCKTGAATNIIYGLASGYMFNVIPIVFIAGTLFVADYWLGAYGMGLAVIGFLSLLPHYLYGSLLYSSLQNSSYLTYIAQFDESLIQSLVEAAKTRKDYEPHLTILQNGLVCYFGFEMILTFVSVSEYDGSTSLRSPIIFLGLLVGAMFPYYFSSNLLRSVQKTAPAIPYDLKIQVEEIPAMAQGNMDPDFVRTSSLFSFQCVLSIKRFVPMLLGPIVVIGIAGGPGLATGFICGVVISAVQLGLSSSMSGCAWTTIKKQIGFNNIRDDEGNPIKSGSDWERAAGVGNSIGQPLKDCVGTALPLMVVYWGLQNFCFGAMYSSIHS